MSYYSSYSDDRTARSERRRRRTEHVLPIIVAMLLATFVSVGTSWGVNVDNNGKSGCEARGGTWSAGTCTEAPTPPTPAEQCATAGKIWTGTACITAQEQCAATPGKEWKGGACVNAPTPAETCASQNKVWTGSECITRQAQCEATPGKTWHGGACIDVVVDETPAGGGHTPVKYCHKPGTNAQHTGESDDDSIVQGHLGHGDTLGACGAVTEVQVPVCRDGVTTLVFPSDEPHAGDVAGACVTSPPAETDHCDTLDGIQAEDADCPTGDDEGDDEGEEPGDDGDNNDVDCDAPAFLAENGRTCKITICARGNGREGATQTIDFNGYHPETDTLPVDGVCAADETPAEDPDVTVCREGQTVTIKTSQLGEGETAGACLPDEDPEVTVCRDGELVTIKQSARQAGDLPFCLPFPCIELPQFLPLFLFPFPICEETDACPGDLNPGIQQEGATCIVETPTDACPDELNPGIQEKGTVCKVAPPVDACPDEALNPGVQAAGTTCVVASTPTNTNSNPTPADTTAGGAAAVGGDSFKDPAVDTDHEPTLGEAAAPDDEDVAPEETEAAAGVDAVEGEDAVAGDGDSLPYTGLTLGSVWGAGLLALLLGSFAYAEAMRAARRRRAGITAA